MNKSSASFWQQRIESVKKNSYYTSWKSVSKAIVERYRGKKTTKDKVDEMSLDKQVGYNLLFRNVKIRMPYLIPYIPNILVERTNKDNDPVARVASVILERVVNKLVSDTHLKEKMDLVKLDTELQGFGNLWLRYCPEFKTVPVIEREEVTDEDGNIIPFEEKELLDKQGNVVEEEKLVSERIEFDYVAPCDFLFNIAKNWSDVEWVARRVYLTKKEFKEQFPDIDITLYDFDEEKEGKELEKDKSASCKCEVWEIWDKSDKKIYFYAPFKKGVDSIDDLIAEKDYPFDIDFPCVKPLMYDDFTDNLIPRPRHAQCWPQYEEVDNITKRISNIIPTIKVAGAVDGSLSGFDKMLSKSNENSLIEITNADKYVEKGGIQNAVMWYDVNVPVNVLKTLVEIREKLTEDIQKTIGVYSIIEGQTNSNEAFGTNRLKGAYGTARIQDDQSKIVYYLEDLLILASDIIAQSFEPENLLKLSTIEFSNENKKLFMSAIDLIKNERMKNVRLEIATEETRAYVDENYKVEMFAFWNNVMSNIKQATDICSIEPTMVKLCSTAIMAQIRTQKVGRTFENEIEQAIEGIIQTINNRLQNPQPPQPTPDKKLEVEAKAQLELEKTRIETQRDIELANKEMFVKQQANDIKAKDISARQAIEEAKLALKQEELDREAFLKEKSINAGMSTSTNIGM